MGRGKILIGAAVAAVIAAGVLAAALSFGSGGSKAPAPRSALAGVAHVANMLRGIPQQGAALGSPQAPVTLVEFVDPQCPYCAEWDRRSLPAVVGGYVRTGKVRIVLDGLAFVGPDSATALRTVVAAGRQNRLWNVLALLFANQGTENTGWVTESLLRWVGDAVPGLDTQRMLDDRSSASVAQAIAQAQALAQQAGVSSTPSFAVGRTGGALRVVQLSSLDPSGITPSLDAVLSQ